MSNDRAVPTADQLRAEIDSGKTGEKVDASDPAAAPLGTDAEAGGSPPTMAELRIEAAARPKRTRRELSRSASLGLLFAGLAVVYAAVLGAGWLAIT